MISIHCCRSCFPILTINWIGTVPCGANGNLLNTVLRDEWGFVGMV
ncbi:MAG: hypothetical protein LUE61_12045 [Clostridiales bacterium]|nr:hypothetical protein [Clostridiales bacterium]